MRFIMNANLDNAAFRDAEDEFDPADLARILRLVADKLETGRERGTCVDINGNITGEWDITR